MYKSCLEKLHYCVAILLFSCFSISSFAQGYDTTKWRFSNPAPLGFSIMDIDYADNNNVIAVGSDGGIAKSTDGGKTWFYGAFTYTTPIGGYLYKTNFLDVHYVTPSVAYAVGNGAAATSSPLYGGSMAKTTDGGITWSLVNNPLYANRKKINTVWFVDQNTGYIAGEWNASDSIPKVYFTTNGGATWDSLVSPSAAKTRIGYIANPNLAPIIHTVTGKGKEINRIMFNNANVGFVLGNSQHATGSVSVTIPASAAAPGCLPTGGTTTSASSEAASLCWKFENGQLLDYSITKERLGFPGLPSGTIVCNTRYASVAPATQSYSAINILSDSVMLIVSNTNNVVLRVFTGKNDSTVNLSTGLKEPGRYEIMNMTSPPPSFPTVPAVNPITLFSNPVNMVRTPSGKIYLPVASAATNPGNRMWTTVDTGRTWTLERTVPPGRNYSLYATIAIDIAPNGKFLMGGTNGVMSDSIPGGPLQSSYLTVAPGSVYNQIEFADCNNGMVVGNSAITVTTDGGKTWIDKIRTDFASSFYTIGGFAYPSLTKSYFAVSNGSIYSSVDQGTTLDPVYSNTNFQMKDVAAIGNDSVWAVGQAASAVPAALKKPGVFRSFNGGLTWTEYSNFFPGNNAQFLTEVEFPSRMIGYACGSRDTIWKTTDAGVTWFKLPLPTPGVTPQITYSDMQALDDNTVILTGNGFPRTVVFKTTDGGATWTDITSNTTALTTGSNILGIAFHDANNGYVGTGGGIFKTTNGGTSWTLDFAPSTGFNALGFAPKKVPAAIPFQNHKLFASSNNILEYGKVADVNVNAAETVVNANCSNPNGGSITVSTTGGIAPYTYSIDGGAFQSSNVFNGLTQGAKTITIKDAYCGVLTKTVTVGFTDNLTLTASNDTTVCAGAPVQLQATATAGATFTWTPGSGLSNPNISNPIATVSAPATFTVRATLNGCVKTEPVSIAIKPNPTVNAGSDKTIVEGDETQLSGSASNVVSVAWTPANTLRDANTLTPVAKPATTTTYTLTVKNSDNCTSTDAVIITVLPYCIKVMNAFSPNGDGANDRWLVTNGSGCTNRIKAAVFNRYGQQVYVNDNYQNNWDGTFNGKPVPDGTYYYAITYFLINGKTATVKGDVTILR